MSGANENEDYFPDGLDDVTAFLRDDEIESNKGQPTEPTRKDAEEEESGKETSSKTRSNPKRLGICTNFTHAAIGEPERKLPCLPPVAAKPRQDWLDELNKDGYAALLFVNAESLSEEPAFESDWWCKNRDILRRRLIKTPLESKACAGILTLKERLPSGSSMSSVMCIVSEFIASDKNCDYCVSTAQLFVPSLGGFSQDFRIDATIETNDEKLYRCFWYLPPIEAIGNDITPPERECIFIGSAGDNTKEFDGVKVLTLAAFYGEAERTFRLHPGDILVMKARFPFAVDLPIGGRAEGARVLSWHVMPKRDKKDVPILMPESETMMSIESIISLNADAMKLYNEEYDAFEISPGEMGDPEKKMLRLRVTPQKYTVDDIMAEVERNDNILYLNDEYFSE